MIEEAVKRLVWLRSREVSYSAEIWPWLLRDDGTVDGMPGFTWEKWPSKDY